MLIESKESMKKRGVKSPDAADTCTYAAALIPGIEDPMNLASKGDMFFQSPYERLALARDGVGTPF